MSVETRVANERIVVNRPISQDVVYIYKIRYTSVVERADDDAGALISIDHKSYYGGIDGTWNEFQPYEALDFEAPGCISMDGRNWLMLRDGIKEMEDQERTQLESVMQDIVTMFRREGSAT